MDVYRGFDQATLDREYTPSSCVESLEPFLREYAGRSAAAREKLAWRSVAYGLTEAETVDFFPAPAPMAPLHIFIHGGYWRQLSKRESSFAAEQFVAAGAAFAAVDYALAPGVTLDEIVRQVRSAVAFLYAEADALGVDRERIYVSGSSAGGHLTPVRLSLVNGWMNLDEAAAWRNSPQRLAPHPGTSVIVAVGDIETGEFKRQSADYAAMCRAAGLACEDFVVPARNHFDVVFDLGDASTMLGAAVRRQMFG